MEYIVPENSPLIKNSSENLDSGFYNSDLEDSRYLDTKSKFNDLEDFGYEDSRSKFNDLEEGTYFKDDNFYNYSDELKNNSSKEDNFKSGNSLDKNDFNSNLDLNDLDSKYAKYLKEDDFDEINGNEYNYLNSFKEDKSKTKKESNYGYYEDLDGQLNSVPDDFYSESNSKKSGSLKDLKLKLKDFKKNISNKNDASKSKFGKIVFTLICLVLVISAVYFFIYQPFQDELNLEKNAKLNELNTLYKGPLEANDNAFYLKNEIENEYDINEIKSIDILRFATKDWQTYHKSKIVSCKDEFGRVMLSYGEEDKDIILSVQDANQFVKDNDAKILSNVQFKEVDTTIVPVSISRLQATAGLISVGSVVDIYSLNDSYSNDYDDEESYSVSSENSSETDVSLDDGGTDDGSEDESDYNQISIDEENQDELDVNGEPDVSGATVLAILRSKDSGVIDSSISKSNTLIDGNTTIPYENTSSYSNDVEELLKASVFKSYDNSNVLESYLDDYGVKLSNYERMSNLGDLDSEYLVLLEVPREDVNFVINNMDNLILTIPTQHAPTWVVSELNATYYENIYSNESLIID
ncbi:hypothetical protein [uncultured Methanobrevibacter sp.]|uniref:hypothetical protein n=1 Tax=uncultured Methanobrevibacter sp. TaxID=253161 RepID=UPI00260DFBF9